MVTLKAGIKMDKYNVQTGEHDISEGDLVYVKQKDVAFRIDWIKPIKEHLSVIRGQYTIYRENINTAYKGSVDRGRNSSPMPSNAFAFLSMSKEQLKKNYDIKYFLQEAISGGIETHHIRLIPLAAADYNFADLWIDKDGVPRQVQIVVKNNDSTTVLLSHPVRNETVKGSSIPVTFPGNAKIVRG